MAVYFIRDADRPEVKIGYSAAPHERLRQLQFKFRRKLQLLKYMPGDLRDEKALHRKFKDEALGYEWFRLSDRLARFIGRRRPAKPKPLDQIFYETILDMQAQGYTDEQVAGTLKISVQTLIVFLREKKQKAKR